jgi:CHAD domain-containing protein
MAQPTSSELVMRQRLTALARDLAGAQIGSVNAVHQSRVATRRLREALPMLASGRKAREVRREVRKLTRVLGPIRELDVALGMLDGLMRDGDVPVASLDVLHQLIATERTALHAAAARRIGRCDMERLRRRAVSAVRKGPELARGRSARESGQSTVIWQRAGRRAERLEAAIESAAGIYLPDRLHKVRIAVKKLRYTLEIARQMMTSRPARPGGQRSTRSVHGQIATLKRAQDLLGHMHDVEVLIARARGAQSSPAATNLQLSGDLDRLVRRLENDCRRFHGRYMASRANLLDICSRVMAAADRALERASAA